MSLTLFSLFLPFYFQKLNASVRRTSRGQADLCSSCSRETISSWRVHRSLLRQNVDKIIQTLRSPVHTQPMLSASPSSRMLKTHLHSTRIRRNEPQTGMLSPISQRISPTFGGAGTFPFPPFLFDFFLCSCFISSPNADGGAAQNRPPNACDCILCRNLTTDITCFEVVVHLRHYERPPCSIWTGPFKIPIEKEKELCICQGLCYIYVQLMLLIMFCARLRNSYVLEIRF